MHIIPLIAGDQRAILPVLLFVDGVKIPYEEARDVMVFPEQLWPKLPSISNTMQAINKNNMKALSCTYGGDFCSDELLLGIPHFKAALILSPTNPNSPLIMVSIIEFPIPILPELFTNIHSICFFDLCF